MKKLVDKHINEFEKYYEYLVSENEKYNLTAIKTKDEAFIKHFEDSLALGNIFDLNGKKLLDVGSGAGFPAIPLKICYPELEVTIIEPTLKRVNFMKSVVTMLGLKGIDVICARAEDVVRDIDKSKDFIEMFDFVVARAVANLSVLLELLVQYAKVNGKIVAYKGDKGKEESLDASNALKLLSCKVEKIEEYSLRDDLGNRSLVVINKNKSTNNKYPRKYAEIKRKPL